MCLLAISGSRVGQRQKVSVLIVRRLECPSSLEVHDRFSGFAILDQRPTQSMVPLKAGGFPFCVCAQSFLSIRCASILSSCSLAESYRFFGESFAGSHYCVRAVSAETRGVGNARNRKTWLVKELGLLRW